MTQNIGLPHRYMGAEHKRGYVRDCLLCQMTPMLEALEGYAEQDCAFGFRVAFDTKTPCEEYEREPDRMCRPCWAKTVLRRSEGKVDA